MFRILFLSLTAALLMACDQKQLAENQTMLAPAGMELLDNDADVATPVNEQTALKKIIKTGELRYQVSDIDREFNKIQDQLKTTKGTITQDISGKNYNHYYRNITIRIPSEQFDVFLMSLSNSVGYFDTKSITTKEVTEEFIDIEARLKTKKNLELKYTALLQQAKSVTEILEIQEALSKVREDLESMEGRLKYLQDQVSLSTLHIELYQNEPSLNSSNQSYFSQMWEAVVDGFRSLSDFILGVLHIWPYLILLALGIFIFKKKWKKKKE